MFNETRRSEYLVAPTTAIWPFNGAVPPDVGSGGNEGFEVEFNTSVSIDAMWTYAVAAIANDYTAVVYDTLTQTIVYQSSTISDSNSGWIRVPCTPAFITTPSITYAMTVRQATALNGAYDAGAWGAGGSLTGGVGAVPATGGRWTAGNTFAYPSVTTNDMFGTDIEYSYGAELFSYFPPRPYDRLLYDIKTQCNGPSTARAYLGAISDSSLLLQGQRNAFTDTLQPVTPYEWPRNIGLYVTWDGGLSAVATARHEIAYQTRM